jgi:HlyD family secretion protein
MINWFKTHWVATTIGVLVIVAGGYGLYQLQAPEPPEVVKDEVEQSDLVQTIDVAGEVESLDQVDLSFETPGTVEEIIVEKDQVVEKGEELARLEAKERRADVKQAQRAVDIARANLRQRRAGSTGEAVQVAQANLDVAEANKQSAEVALENAKEDLERVKDSTRAAVDQAQTDLQASRDDLQQTRETNKENIRHAREDLIPVLKSAMVSVRSALSQADEVIGVDNSLANDEFENVLSTLNEQYLIWAENAYEIAKESRDEAEDDVFSLQTTDEQVVIDEAIDKTKEALRDADEVLLQTRRVLDATTVDTKTFSFTELSNLKTAVDGARDAVRNADNTLVTQVQALEQTRTNANTSELAAENTVEKAERALVKIRADREQQITSAESAVSSAESSLEIRTKQVTQAEANLAQTEAGPRAVDVASLESEVERARSQLEATQARLEKTVLRSPISGTVTQIDVEEGEQVSATMPVLTVQTTEEAFRIVVDIPEADVAKVELDDPASVTFDAFGEDQRFAGRVVNVDPAEKVIEGVVYYEGEVELEEAPPILKPGLSTDVTVTTQTAKNVVHVPQRAVLETDDGRKYVRIMEGEEMKRVFVETGMRADGGRREITSGLRAGQEVVVSIRD